MCSTAGEMNDAGEVLLTLYEAIDSVAQVSMQRVVRAALRIWWQAVLQRA